MDSILAGLRNSRCYIDDISNWSNTFEDHLQHLRQVFHRLRQFKLKCHPRKCLFFADEMDFLGHKISGKGIAPQDEKTRARYADTKGCTPTSRCSRVVFILPQVRSTLLHDCFSTQRTSERGCQMALGRDSRNSMIWMN